MYCSKVYVFGLISCTSLFVPFCCCNLLWHDERKRRRWGAIRRPSWRSATRRARFGKYLEVVEAGKANFAQPASSCRTRSLARQKKYIYNPQHINGLSYHPLNYKTEFLTSYLYKTRHLTAQDGFVARVCYSGVVLSFSFLFISVIFKKIIVNFRKIIK